MDKSKMTGHSADPQAELLARLQKEMPEIFSEGKIDFSKLKATLGEDVIADGERYGLSWAGKSDCFRQIQETTTNTLKPCREESVNFDNTENLFIEGDNLQAMKVLQKSYYGKIKMIYIDPPYNTGNDFIYNDKFSQAKKEYLLEVGAIDELGNVVNAELYRQNTRDSGHFHSTWLNMMYPRLFLARNLLRQDGVIFVSIDDNEVANLRKMMDEIFGEENFVGQFVWKNKKGGGNDSKHVAIEHEYIFMFARNKEVLNPLFFDFSEDYLKRYKEADEGGRFFWDTFKRKSGKQYYPIECPDGTVIEHDENGNKISWLRSENRFKEDLKKGEVRIIKINGGWTVHVKQRLPEGKKPRTILDSYGTTSAGSKELLEIFQSNIFPNPKPSSLLKHFAEFITDKNDIVLDFFAGSGTTAHAVAQLNAEDGGNRKWICVQLPEKCKDESEAAKAGYSTIADIAKERIRRTSWQIFTKDTSTIKSIFKIAEGDNDELKKERERFDKWIVDNSKFGFRVFKLKESNFKVWNTQIESVEQLEQQMIDFLDNVREGATTEDLLYELILKSGHELNVPIEEKKADGQSYYRVGDGTIVICLADKMNKPLFEAIAKDKPEKIITLDRVFGNNDQLKTNIMLQAEHAGVKEFKVI